MTNREDEFEATLAAAREETRAAFANRALAYSHLFDVLEEELGTERATDLMKRAIYRRGLEVAAKYRPAASAGDLAEVGRLFVETSPSGGRLFSPSVEEYAPDEGRIVLRMDTCALKDAWIAAGYPSERVDLLCEIAAAVDYGTFEGAGLDICFLDRQPAPGGCGRCLLKVTLPKGAS
jgi:hypothetical protein